MLQTYLNRIHDVAQQRGMRKDYFHWSLGNLIRDYAEDAGLEDVRIVVLAKARRTDNAADLRIENGAGDAIGYVRTTAPDAVPDEIQSGGDVKPGGPSGPSNLLMTNFYRFRLYRKGELKEAVTINPPTADADEGAQASDEDKAAFSRLIRAFLRPT